MRSQKDAQEGRIDWKANWIWHPETERMDNFYMYARKIVNLPGGVGSARVFCTCYNEYKLYINGKFVGRGPAPSDPNWQYYDEYDIKSHLRVGENVFAAVCYNYGRGTKCIANRQDGPGGFFFQGEIKIKDGKSIKIITDKNWRVLHAEWLSPFHALRINNWVGAYKEEFDAKQEPRGWFDSGFNDSSWEKPVLLGTPPVKPWLNLLPRDIPQLRQTRIFPAGVIRADENFGRVINAESMLKDDGKYAVIDASVPNSAPAVLLDFGKQVVGYLKICIKETKGGTAVFSYGESLDLEVEDRLIMGEEPLEWSPFNRKAFRYLQITFLATPQPVKIKSVSLDLTTYPVEYRGSFECSDELLNKIWDVGRYTVQLCMQNHFEDCTWRERALWVADMRIGALVGYYAFGDRKLIAKCLRQMARNQAKDGSIPAVGPAKNDILIPDFCAYWVIALKDYYIYTGEADLLNSLYPNLRRVMKWFEDQLNGNGLIGRADRKGWWCFIDWADEIEKKDEVTALQCLYYKALKDARDISNILGHKEIGEKYSLLAEKTKKSINKYLWSERISAYVDCRSSDGPSKHISQQTNCLAVLCSVAEPENRAKIHKNIFANPKVKPTRTPFMNFYVAESLFHSGYEKEAIDLIRNYWGEMLKRDAASFWEIFDRQTPSCVIPRRVDSHCHGWSAGPTFILMEQVLGVRPLDPGFAAFAVEPHPVDLKWAKGVVPSPLGDISVNWSRSDDSLSFMLKVSVPKKCTADIILPKLKMVSPKVMLNGNLIFTDGKPVLSMPVLGEVYEDEKRIYVGLKKSGIYHIEARTTRI